MNPRRVRDFALYILISLGVASGAIWYAAQTERSSEALGNWVGLAAITALLFGYSIQRHRRLLPRFSFWALIGGLLCVHLCAFVVILLRVEHWRLFWFVLAYPVESVSIELFIRRCFRETGL